MSRSDDPGRIKGSRFIKGVRVWVGVFAWAAVYSTQPLGPMIRASASEVHYSYGVNQFQGGRTVINPLPGIMVDYNPPSFHLSLAPAARPVPQDPTLLNSNPIPTLPAGAGRSMPPTVRPSRVVFNDYEDEQDDGDDVDQDDGNQNSRRDDDGKDDEDDDDEDGPRSQRQQQRPPPRTSRPAVRPPPQRQSPRSEDDERARPNPAVPQRSGSSKMLSLGQSKRLAHGPAYPWNGCDQNALIRGGYNGKCSTDYLHPSFAEHINKHLLACAQEAAAKVGNPPPVRLFISHMGCYSNRSIRGGSGLSNHAYARAIDMASMTMIDAGGRETKMTNHVRSYSGKNKQLYDAFRSCWKANLPRSCQGQKGSIGIPRSPLGGNSLHNDHIHLEFPPRCG